MVTQEEKGWHSNDRLRLELLRQDSSSNIERGNKVSKTIVT